MNIVHRYSLELDEMPVLETEKVYYLKSFSSVVLL